MYDPFDDSNEGRSAAWRDVMLLVLMAFLFIIVIILPFIVKPVDEESPDAAADLTVSIVWAPDDPSDIDLWVSDPVDRKAVGWSRKSGQHFNLLRDDRGWLGDPLDVNHEIAFARAPPAGRYIVNIHYYTPHGQDHSVDVRVVVQILVDNHFKKLFDTVVTLPKNKSEDTVFVFWLDKEGKLVRGGPSGVFYNIRGSS